MARVLLKNNLASCFWAGCHVSLWKRIKSGKHFFYIEQQRWQLVRLSLRKKLSELFVWGRGFSSRDRSLTCLSLLTHLCLAISNAREGLVVFLYQEIDRNSVV